LFRGLVGSEMCIRDSVKSNAMNKYRKNKQKYNAKPMNKQNVKDRQNYNDKPMNKPDSKKKQKNKQRKNVKKKKNVKGKKRSKNVNKTLKGNNAKDNSMTNKP
jgi:hypothetical protein